MKKICLSGLLWGYFILLAFSQNEKYVDGGHFIKRIEYNVQSQYDHSHNLNSKDGIQRLFFGDFNAPVEFYYLPSSEAAYTEAHSGFRIVRSPSNTSYVLEVKYISNYREARTEARKKFPTIGFNLTTEHNKVALVKQNEVSLKLYKIETLSFPANNQFAERLYKNMVLFIDNFKAKGVPPVIFDGYWVTYRSVVEDEVWSLSIHMPQGDALKMTDLCRQIITDVKNGKPDEQKYMTVMDTFEN